VSTETKTLSINLVAMSKPRLHHTFAAFHLRDESMDVGVHLGVDLKEMARDDRTQQNSTKARKRIGGQDQVTQ
jgi:hypothetical protein